MCKVEFEVCVNDPKIRASRITYIPFTAILNKQQTSGENNGPTVRRGFSQSMSALEGKQSGILFEVKPNVKRVKV